MFNLQDSSPEGLRRSKTLKEILPKETIIATVLEPVIEKRLFDILATCVQQELEIYRKYPKAKAKEKKEEVVKTFDPRNNKSCFMGKGFQHNDSLTNSDLNEYRKAIGTIKHPVWGDCTLMEIWGGDHFEEHNKMVVDAFKYGMNLIDKAPKIKFFVNPLFQNKKSKEFKLSPAQIEYNKEREELLAKAMVFGVRSPAEAKRARRR